MKDIFVRAWATGALTGALCALALVAGAATAHATQLGVVDFSNGSTQPTKIPSALVAQAQAAARGHGHVILLRGGASPVGSKSYNFVLSGERTAAIRDRLVAVGIPRKKIVSQFVGIVNRGSAAADRAVIIDATTRQALGLAVPASQGQEAALTRLEAQVRALEAAHKAAALPKTVRVKAKAHHAYTGSVWYDTRTTQYDNGGTVVGVNLTGGGVAGAVVGQGDNYQQRGYGFDLRERRPTSFNFWTPWTIPLQFSLSGMSQTQQVANPIMQDVQGVTYTGNGIIFYPVNARDSVSTEFLHGSIQSPWKVFGMTVTPGVKVGWLSEQSLTGAQSTQVANAPCSGISCFYVTETDTAAVGGSALSVTPSLSIGGQGWQIGYSQSPWGGSGYYSPRVLMGTVRGRGVSLSLGMAFPDCPMCSSGGAAIQNGQIVKFAVHGGGWGGSLIYVAGEQFEAGGSVMPATLMQTLAPFNPSRPWNSYNPGLTLSVSKRLTKNVRVSVMYGLDHQGGSGYSANQPSFPLSEGGPSVVILPSSGASTATTKTEEISVRGRF